MALFDKIELSSSIVRQLCPKKEDIVPGKKSAVQILKVRYPKKWKKLSILDGRLGEIYATVLDILPSPPLKNSGARVYWSFMSGRPAPKKSEKREDEKDRVLSEVKLHTEKLRSRRKELHLELQRQIHDLAGHDPYD